MQVRYLKVADNGSQLQEVAKFVTEIFMLLLNFLRNVNVNLPLNLPFLVTAVTCCLFFFVIILKIFIKNS